jgi:hypothetical protein
MFPSTLSVKNAIDMFPRTDRSKDINFIISSHVETVVFKLAIVGDFSGYTSKPRLKILCMKATKEEISSLYLPKKMLLRSWEEHHCFKSKYGEDTQFFDNLDVPLRHWSYKK